MENASKALLMAAGVLIGVLILSLGVYLFVNFSQHASQTYDQIKEDQINQFNSEFVALQGKNITIYDVISVVRKAREYNEVNEVNDEDNGIKVTLKGHDDSLNVENLSLKSSTEQLTDISKYPKDNIEREFQTLIEKDRGYMTQVDEDQDEQHIKETISGPIYTCTNIEYDDSQRVKSVEFEFDKNTWEKWLGIN